MNFPITNEVDFRFQYAIVKFVRDANDKNLWRVNVVPGEHLTFQSVRAPTIRINHEPSFPFAFRAYQAWLDRSRNEDLVNDQILRKSRFTMSEPSDGTLHPRFIIQCRFNRTH